MKRLFGTDGIRAEAGSYPLDPRTITRVGGALARILGERHPERSEPRILIGRDTRESGEWIEAALASGARRAGARCESVGVLPTPGVACLARTLGYTAGVMISASHNPYRDNGIKIFSASGYKLPDDEEAGIEALVLDDAVPLPDPEASPGRAEPAPAPARDRYFAFLRESVEGARPFAGMRLVLDCANGAACAVAPAIFSDLGAEVSALFTEPDGRNINLDCGSLHPATLAATVLAKRADLGIAFDGDADRTLFVAGDGRIADGDLLLYQAAGYLLAHGRLPGARVVATVMSNLWLERALAERGISLARTRVGDKYVLEEMLRTGAALGGEQSGHIIFADRATTGDGILTALRLTEVLKATGGTVAGWMSEVKAYPQVLLNVRVASRPDLEAHPVIGAEAARVREQLGTTGRLVLRYSGTEPLARVMIEGADRAQVEELAAGLAEIIRKAIG